MFNEFMPHGHCIYWTKSILWPSVIGDSMIQIAYLAIPHMLWVTRKRVKHLLTPLSSAVFIGFIVFIISCGFTHAFNVIEMWIPLYRLGNIIKIICGISSWVTVLLCYRRLKSL